MKAIPSRIAHIITDNTVEIRTDFQAKLVSLPEPSQTVDFRFTAPPSNQFKLIASSFLQNKRKKIEGNIKKNRKQSILLTRGIKKFKNNKKVLQKNSEGTTDRDNKKSFRNSKFRPSTEFWRRNRQSFATTNHSDTEKQIINLMNFQRLKNIEYQNNETKSVAVDQREIMGSENERYEQIKSLTSRKGMKAILPMSEAKGDDDFDLLINPETNYPDMLTPKSSIWSDHMQFINKMNKRMEHDKQKQREHQSLNPDCVRSTAINNQPWNPMNTIVQLGKIGTPQIPIVNRFPFLASQDQLNYQQNPVSWDRVSIFQGPTDQFVTPIIPANGIFNNFVHMGPSALNLPWMPNRGKTMHQLWRTINSSTCREFNELEQSIKNSASPMYTGYAEPALRTLPLPTATSIPKTNPLFDDFRFYNGVPTMKTTKSNDQNTGSGTSVHGNQQQQKDQRTHLEMKYPINPKMNTSETMDSMGNQYQHRNF
ncbi:unnamed protein product [Cercopithifilaria johnstoni]|uniref:Uncharacterized protein n=1 Tax=Cercopithifilaria johnstoni TaxID=2874296 RepID=A0A8J2PU20_9BILA|nr:unnamed protein product [Cercopithifilaria johnstoni]